MLGDPDDPTATFGFKYDAFGERVVKESEDATTFSAGKLYDRTITSTATIHRLRIYADGQEVVQIDVDEGTGTEEYAYLHRDALSSVLFHTNADGESSELRDFDVFGEQVANPSWAEEVLDSFTGHELDEEFGLVNIGALWPRSPATDLIQNNLIILTALGESRSSSCCERRRESTARPPKPG